jgi:hypothetical protein
MARDATIPVRGTCHGENDETDLDQVQDKAGNDREKRRADRRGVCGIARPDGVRYLSLRPDDGSFIHFVETEAGDGSSALPNPAAFKAFQSGIRERCAEPPQVGNVTIVGNYRMLGDTSTHGISTRSAP